MKKLLVLTSILVSNFFISSPVFAQDTDPFSYNANIIPSAESYSMIKNGNVTPSLYTGAMSYSIPIYTYDDEDFTIPISINYNYDGYKPSSPSGFIGLGWSLNCGGIITREVVGLPDEYIDSNIRGYIYSVNETSISSYLQSGDYRNLNIITQVSPVLPDNEPVELFFGTTPLVTSRPVYYYNYILSLGNYYYDTASDIYHFILPDGSCGDFVILPNGKVQVYNSTLPPGEISVILNFSSIGYQAVTIKTGDGYDYRFGGDMNYLDLSYDAHWTRGNLPFGPSTFCFAALKLNLISAPNGRNLEFDYNSEKPEVSISYSAPIRCGARTIDNILSYSPDQNSNFNLGTFLQPTYFSRISRFLKSIKVDDTIIVKFHYTNKAAFEYGPNAFSPSTSGYELFMPEINGNIGSYSERFNSKNQLSSISVYNFANETIDSITFNQSFTSSQTGHSPKMFLTGVNMRDGHYSFEYNNNNSSDLYPPIDCIATDHWGYWRGSGGEYYFNNTNVGNQEHDLYNVYSNDRNPDSTRTSYGALRRIVYPQGGSTSIDYEMNRANKRINIDLSNVRGGYYLESCQNYLAGGLRVKRIINNCGIYGTHSDTTTYQYNNSGISTMMPRYVSRMISGLNENGSSRFDRSIRINISDVSYGHYISIQKCSNTPLYVGYAKEHIGYSNVCVVQQDKSRSEYSFFDYSSFPDEYAPNSYFREERSGEIYAKTFCCSRQCDYDFITDKNTYNLGPLSEMEEQRNEILAGIKTCDMSSIRGRLESRTDYDSHGNIVKIQANTYRIDTLARPKEAFNCYSHILVERILLCQPRLVHTANTIVCSGARLTQHSSYEYNTFGQITCKEIIPSANRNIEKVYFRYAHESDDTALKSEVSDVVETKTVGGGEYVTAYSHFNYGVAELAKPTSLTMYNIETPYLLPNNVFTVPNLGTRQYRYQYNSMHRLTKATYQGNAYIQYVWDSENRHIISRTENGPANETTYQWKDLVGLSQKRTPTYQMEYYEYDEQGRLKRVKNTSGSTVTSYDYFLNNDNNNSND